MIMVDVDFLSLCVNGPEILVYLVIEAFSNLDKPKDNSSIEEKIYHTRLQSQYQCAMAQTIRFGVGPSTINGELSENFIKWHAWWKEYIDSLTDDEFDQLNYDLNMGINLELWRPKDSWQK